MRPKINTPQDGRCGYICFYSGKQAEVWANDLWSAKQKAIAYFKAPKSKLHMVSVALAEVENKAVVHVAEG